MPQSESNDKVIRLATAPNPAIAASWQEMLRLEGIPSMLKIDDPLGVAYHVASPYPCGIYVLEAHAERARKLLDELAEDDAQDAESGQEEE